jgi:hypothetical protein
MSLCFAVDIFRNIPTKEIARSITAKSQDYRLYITNSGDSAGGRGEAVTNYRDPNMLHIFLFLAGLPLLERGRFKHFFTGTRTRSRQL